MIPIIVVGEVLWDLFDHTARLGGAPLNFGVHARRLGYPVTLISAVGRDELGNRAAGEIATLDLDTRLLRSTSRFPTGTARVEIGPDGSTQFSIPRPAAFDAVELSAHDGLLLEQLDPGWLYYGTLFASGVSGKTCLDQIFSTLPGAKTIYDLNLRPGADSPELVRELLSRATVVKLNADELQRVHEWTALPAEPEAFAYEGSRIYGWQAVGVTLGDRGCAILANGEYVEAECHPVHVVDTVGAGDGFAAAFVHGLSQNWPVTQIASFANRVGAIVASRHGAIPDWTFEEALQG